MVKTVLNVKAVNSGTTSSAKAKLGVEIHKLLCEHESYSWVCLNCGLPNFSTGLFDDQLSTLHTSNNFESLDPTHYPLTFLSPLRSNDQQNKCTSNAQQKLKILNVYFQSVVNKVANHHCLVETERPDVIIGTESWLSPDIKDSEIFPEDYTSYRADRTTKTTYSGVFLY